MLATDPFEGNCAIALAGDDGAAPFTVAGEDETLLLLPLSLIRDLMPPFNIELLTAFPFWTASE